MRKRIARLITLMAAFGATAYAASAVLAVDPFPSAAAQVPMVESTKSPEMRAVYANAANVAEGKQLAETACAGCHGHDGISSTDGVPNLAGQRPAYLYLELRAYQSGARGNTAMSGAVKFLSDDALVKVSAYYASLEPAQPVVAPAAKAAPAKADPVQAGRAAAASCSGCHGDAGVSKTPGTPSLAGLDPQYLVAAMKAYKSNRRKSDVMKAVMSALSDPEVNNIALYYALQKPAVTPTARSGDAAAGKAAAAACAGCHGETGISATATTIPTLAGQDAQYLAVALHAYKDGSRSDETMKALSTSVDEATAKNLAAFYASQQPKQANIRKPLSTAAWVQRCDRCHGANGNSTDPRWPALAAQRVEYLEKVLHAYRTGERKSPQMAAMSEVLTESDVENLATYYARQKARAVVYVIVPPK